MRRSATGLLLAATVTTACYIDFRQGLECRTNADCFGLTCQTNSTCGGASVAPAGTDGGSSSVLSVAQVSVVGVANGDDYLSPGETGGLIVELSNNGTATISGLSGSLTTTTAGVTITNGVGLQFGTLTAEIGAPVCGNTQSAGLCNDMSGNFPQVALAGSVAVGTNIAFQLNLTDGSGIHYTVPFSYTVKAVDQTLSVQSITIAGVENGDDWLSPGVTGALIVEVGNNGTSNALGVTGNLTTTTTGVTIMNGTGLMFGTLEAQNGGTTCGNSQTAGLCNDVNNDFPQITLARTLSAATKISFQLALTDSLGNAVSLPFTYQVKAIDQSFVVSVVTVVNDSAGNGFLSPGDTAGLAIEVDNNGSSNALGIVGTLTTSSGSATITNGTGLQFGTINAQDQSTTCGNRQNAGQCNDVGQNFPQISVSGSAVVGSSIPLNFSLTDQFGNTFHVSGSVEVQ